MFLNDVKNRLVKKGFIIEDESSVVGQSGVKHQFSFIVLGKSGRVAIDVSDGSDLLKDIACLYAKCLDAEIKEKIIILSGKVKVKKEIVKLAKDLRVKLMKLPLNQC